MQMKTKLIVRDPCFTSVAGKEAPVLRAEIAVLLVKGAAEPVPPAEKRKGFNSLYFIAPEKGGGLRQILDLRDFLSGSYTAQIDGI